MSDSAETEGVKSGGPSSALDVPAWSSMLGRIDIGSESSEVCRPDLGVCLL